MYEKRFQRRMVAAATLAALAMSGGCVLYIGDDGAPRRGHVEWSPGTDHGSHIETRRVDSALAGDVAARFQADSALAGEDITVASSDDVVTLHGRVRDLLLLENALRIASETPGVARVVSRVTVEMEVN